MGIRPFRAETLEDLSSGELALLRMYEQMRAAEEASQDANQAAALAAAGAVR